MNDHESDRNDKYTRSTGRKTYLKNNSRSKKNRKNGHNTTDDAASVKDSLSKFLADTEIQDTNLIDPFKGKKEDKDNNNDHKSTITNKDDSTNTNNNNDSQDILFDRKALMKVSRQRSSKTKLRPRRTNSKSDLTGGRNSNNPDRRPRRRTKKSEKKCIQDGINNSNEYVNGEEIKFDDMESFANNSKEDESDVSISSSDSKKESRRKRIGRRSSPGRNNKSSGSRRNSTSSRSLSRVRSTSRRSHSLRRQPPSSNNSTRSEFRLPRRTRSECRGREKKNTARSNNDDINKSLAMGLEDLNRRVRRDRMKKEYRSPSLDPRYSRQDTNDGGESVASNLSHRSTFTTRSSYKPSGLEGGALNALMGNEYTAQNASLGKGVIAPSGNCSVVNEPADEDFFKSRKASQDLIMDVALKEKWRHEAEQAKEIEKRESEIVASEYYSSDEEMGEKKKKGIVKKIKKAARKTGKVTTSGAKGARNVVRDPKRAAKNAGKVTKLVGKETAKMVMDPSLAAKRGTKGIKGTVNLTANVAKGTFDVTSSLTRKGVKGTVKGTAKVVGGTIDGAGRVVNGATDIIFRQDDDKDTTILYDDYDARLLSDNIDRQVCKKTFVEQLSLHDEEHQSDPQKNFRRITGKQFDSKRPDDSDRIEIIVPTLDVVPTQGIKKKKSKANKNNGWWDL